MNHSYLLMYCNINMYLKNHLNTNLFKNLIILDFIFEILE